jgi:hypothetical protein
LVLSWEGVTLRWGIELRESRLDDRLLSDLLASVGFRLTTSGDARVIVCEGLDLLDSAGEVWERAKQLARSFTGSASIDDEFAVGAVYDFSTDPPRRHVFAEGKVAALSVTVHAAAVTISPPPGLTHEEIERRKARVEEQRYQRELGAKTDRLLAVYSEPRAERVLALLAKEEQTGESLFKVYELMAGENRAERRFLRQFELDMDTIDRFKDAVHNASVTGDWARHATERRPRTDNPMSPEEAERFIRIVVERWISKVASDYRSKVSEG